MLLWEKNPFFTFSFLLCGYSAASLSGFISSFCVLCHCAYCHTYLCISLYCIHTSVLFYAAVAANICREIFLTVVANGVFSASFLLRITDLLRQEGTCEDLLAKYLLKDESVRAGCSGQHQFDFDYLQGWSRVERSALSNCRQFSS